MRKLEKVEIVINTTTEKVASFKAVMTTRELTSVKNKVAAGIGAATIKRNAEAADLRAKLAELGE
jgi:hypothetical protein